MDTVTLLLKTGSKETMATKLIDLDPDLYKRIEDPGWWTQDPRVTKTFMKKTIKPLTKMIAQLTTLVSK